MEEEKQKTNVFERYDKKKQELIWALDTRKLKHITEKKPALLFFFGTFCPIHKGHIDVMKEGEKYIIEKFGTTHEIVGGFMSPCHSQYMYWKLKDLSIPNSLRNYLIARALENDPVWSLDPYMSLTKTFVSNDEILLDFH